MEKDDDVWRSWQAPIREKFCTASLLTFHPSFHQPLHLQEEYDSSGEDEEEDLKTPRHHSMTMMRRRTRRRRRMVMRRRTWKLLIIEWWSLIAVMKYANRIALTRNLHTLSWRIAIPSYRFLLWWNSNLQFCMLPNCYNLSTDFGTVFVFALGPFLPMWVLFFDFNRNFNGKMSKICYRRVYKDLVSSAGLQFHSFINEKESSKIIGQLVTIWEHARLQISNVINIRIPL